MPLQPVILLSSPRLAFVHGLGGRFRVREVRGWTALANELPSEHPASVVIVDPYDAGQAPCGAFWEVLERFPSVAIVPAFDAREERMDHMRAMVLAGVSEFLDLDREDTPPLVGARIQSAFARPFKRRLDAALSRHVAVEARTILTAAAEVAVRGQGPQALADAFGVQAKTLGAWCAAHALPIPRRVLAWLRILLAAHLLEDAARTKASVAAACGYRTDRSLRRIIQRFVGPALPEALFESAARKFNAELRQCREEMRSALADPGRVANPMQDGDVQSYPAPASGTEPDRAR